MDYQRQFNVSDDIWLQKMEGICYFETDPSLSQEVILGFGRKLRTALYTSLGNFADAIDLIDKEEFYKTHADFCSRLGMTFSHGDYSSIDAIEEKEKVAEKLFRKALSYFPDHRAYLGLGVLKQNEGKIEGAVQILSEGVKHFPESEQLNVCLGINYTNLGQYEQALAVLLKFQHSQKVSYCIARCYNALGDRKKEAGFLEKQIQKPDIDG